MKLSFQFAILLDYELFITQPDFIAWSIALRLYSLIMGLFLKFLGVVDILLVNGYKIL